MSPELGNTLSFTKEIHDSSQIISALQLVTNRHFSGAEINPARLSIIHSGCMKRGAAKNAWNTISTIVHISSHPELSPAGMSTRDAIVHKRLKQSGVAAFQDAFTFCSKFKGIHDGIVYPQSVERGFKAIQEVWMHGPSAA
jgi:hypothetical protein